MGFKKWYLLLNKSQYVQFNIFSYQETIIFILNNIIGLVSMLVHNWKMLGFDEILYNSKSIYFWKRSKNIIFEILFFFYSFSKESQVKGDCTFALWFSKVDKIQCTCFLITWISVLLITTAFFQICFKIVKQNFWRHK